MLDDCKVWAVVGLSGDTRRTAFSIAALLQERGKQIVPIHPAAASDGGLTVLGQTSKFGVQAKVAGGGVTGWAGAISHGIARALVHFDETLKPQLRRYGLMTRDPREKERKKYGLKRARKATQYTKR